MFRFVTAAALAVTLVIQAPSAASAAPGPDGAVTAVLSAINAERSNAGLDPVSLDGGMTAQGAADEYLSSGVAHGPGNSWSMSGNWHSREIAASVSGPSGEAVSLWMGSAGHRRAILDDSADSVRIGVACRPDDGRMFVVAQMRVRHGSGAAEPNGSVTSPTSGPRCSTPEPEPTPDPSVPAPIQPPAPAPIQPRPSAPIPAPTQPRPSAPAPAPNPVPAPTLPAPTTTAPTPDSTTVPEDLETEDPETSDEDLDDAEAPEDGDELPPIEGPEGAAPPPVGPETPGDDGEMTVYQSPDAKSSNAIYLVIAAVALVGAIGGVVLLYRYGTSRTNDGDYEDEFEDDFDDEYSAHTYDSDSEAWGPSTP